MLPQHERNYGLGMDAATCCGNTNGIMVWAWMLRGLVCCNWNKNGITAWAWMLWCPYALVTRKELWFGHGCSWFGHGCCGAPYALGCSWNTKGSRLGHGCSGDRMLLEHGRNYGLGKNALLIVCSWNTKGSRLGHGCSGDRMLLEHERNYGLGRDAHGFGHGCCGAPYALGTRMEVWLGHGCSGDCMLLEHERNYGLGMDVLVIVCSRNTSGIMVWVWMLW